ncbi:hypothetical protein GCM10022200_05280 [Microbacterium awajiense]|uniref:Uncharacterized protein n=1 Tax=Microbacterium awajiense TaxID=415214 RepID=A0ABP7A6C5_9MICO
MTELPEAIRLYARPRTDLSARTTVTTRTLYDPAAEWHHDFRVPSPAHVAKHLIARHLDDIGPALRGDVGMVIRRDGELVELTRSELHTLTVDLLDAMPSHVSGLRELARADVYRGLHAFLRLVDDEERDAFINAVVAAVPTALKRLPTVKPTTAPRPAPKTAAERQEAYRVRRAQHERETVEAFLTWAVETHGTEDAVSRAELLNDFAEWLDAPLGDREKAVAKHTEAREKHDDELGLFELHLMRYREEVEHGEGFTPIKPEKPKPPANPWPAIAAEKGHPLNVVEVGPRRALALFRELGVVELSRKGERFHRIPDPSPREDIRMHEAPETIHARAAAIRDEATALADRNTEHERELDLFARRLELLQARDLVGALTLQAETLPAPEGGLIEAADRFTRRAA